MSKDLKFKCSYTAVPINDHMLTDEDIKVVTNALKEAMPNEKT
jgi:hypothetical protein